MSALLRRGLSMAAALAAAVAGVSLAVPAAAAPRAHPPAAHAHHAARHSHHAARHSHHAARHSHHAVRHSDPARHSHEPAASGAHDPILVLHAGGIRQPNGTVSGLAGVTFTVRGGNLPAPSSCTTAGTVGTCDVRVLGGTRYTVMLTGAPPGWFGNATLGVGTAPLGRSDGRPYETYTTPTISRTAVHVNIPVATLLPDTDTTGTGGPLTTRGSPWAVSKDDPGQPAGCELNIAMLFALSSPIVMPHDYLPQYLSAGQDFVRALDGTPTRVAVYTFGTDSPATSNASGNNTTLPLTPVTTATGVNSTLISKIGGLTVQGAQFTNWDAGLRRIAANNSADPASPHHLNFVVVLTDGDPTKFLATNGTTVLGLPVPARTRFIEVENGIFSANELKNQQTTVIGVGIAPGAPGTPMGISRPSIDNLRSISGPTIGREYFTPSFGDLADQLRDLVLSRCSGTVNVIKKVVSPTGTVKDAQLGGGGWEFTATRTAPPIYETRTTDAETSGVSFNTGTSRAPVTVTEGAHPAPGYTFLPDETTCRNTTTDTTVTPTRHPDGFTVAPDPHGVISCTVFNRVTPKPAITITKSAFPTEYGAPGEEITYTYVVKNTGNVPLHDINVEDDVLGHIVCPRDQLLPGESMECEGIHITTPEDVDAGRIHNVVVGTGRSPENEEVTDDDEATVIALHMPDIQLEKTAFPTEYAVPGHEITYTYRVVNTGNVTLHDIALTDSRLGPITCPHTTLAAGAEMECTATHTITVADVDAGHIHNVATVTGRSPTEEQVSDTAEATVTAVHKPGIEIEKSASPVTFSAAGQTIAYTYRVANVGNVTLHNVMVHDSRVGTVTCPSTVLAPGAEMTCTATYITTQADVAAGRIPNFAIVRGRTPKGVQVLSPPAEALVVALLPGVPVTG